MRLLCKAVMSYDLELPDARIEHKYAVRCVNTIAGAAAYCICVPTADRGAAAHQLPALGARGWHLPLFGALQLCGISDSSSQEIIVATSCLSSFHLLRAVGDSGSGGQAFAALQLLQLFAANHIHNQQKLARQVHCVCDWPCNLTLHCCCMWALYARLILVSTAACVCQA